MYLFQRSDGPFNPTPDMHLHSTMYLFQLRCLFRPIRHYLYLHSTMYLFQHSIGNFFKLSLSIYIPLCIYFNQHIRLIEQSRIRIYIPLCIYFNSFRLMQVLFPTSHLHSTMYLFQLEWLSLSGYTLVFTFHYVSISTNAESCIP